MYLITWNDAHNEDHHCSWLAWSLGEPRYLFSRWGHATFAMRPHREVGKRSAKHPKRRGKHSHISFFEVIKAAWGLKIQLDWAQCWAVSLLWPQWSLDHWLWKVKAALCYCRCGWRLRNRDGGCGVHSGFQETKWLGSGLSFLQMLSVVFWKCLGKESCETQKLPDQKLKDLLNQWDFLIIVTVRVLCSCRKSFSSYITKPMGRSSLSSEKCVMLILSQKFWMGFSWKSQEPKCRA